MKSAKRIYLETYGCQMNVADSEVVLRIMDDAGYARTAMPEEADVVLVNTCAVRENAEVRVHGRLGDFKHLKKSKPELVIGVLGCMAERLRKDIIESKDFVDLIVGPDEYRKLPMLVESAMDGERGIAVRLSRVENYDDILPLRTDGVCAWLSVMRGCDKFCTFCVVPFTRGRERSRSFESILREVRQLAEAGFKEITLLGQNVNSYKDGEYDFAALLSAVAGVDRTIRVRFTTSHPQDMSDALVDAIAQNQNICNYIHLPVQSGSNRILEMMNRTYSAEHYLRLVDKIRRAIPAASLSTDIIAGFPGETDDDHRLTVELLRRVEFDGAFTFKYSPRENTRAWGLGDTVPDSVKVERLDEIIDVQRSISHRLNERIINTEVEVLVEGPSKKSADEFCGRTDTNRMVIFPKDSTVAGEYRKIRIGRVNAATLFGRAVSRRASEAA